MPSKAWNRSPDGDFVVVWDSYGSAGTDDSSRSIQGQRFAEPACASQIDLTSGTSGSVTGQGGDETRGIDLTVNAGCGDLRIVSMTLDGVNVTGSSATLGARIYDSSTTALLASADKTLSTGSVQSVTVPILATLRVGNDYRVAFFLDTVGGGTTSLFDPDPAGVEGFPYEDATRAVEVNQAYSISSDSFPSNVNFFVPQITLNLEATAVPSLGSWGLLVMALGLSVAGVAAAPGRRHPR